ncbi:MAG: FAD-dependent oxidoreductase [Microbacteriaceae bacterium]|nr:FAD-dependent oxidoreductase [Burkholderiaceae bacterium]
MRRCETVRRVHWVGAYVELQVETAAGSLNTWRVDQVLLALPSRLAKEHIAFDPPLLPKLPRRWRGTPTWMAPQAKYAAFYDTPFWPNQGLSGSARSQHGPIGEIHDVSMPGGHAALFGFLGVPARVRRGLADDALRTHCRAQLARLFGEAAGRPVADALKDWAADPLTATDDDQDAAGHHAEPPERSSGGGSWLDRLIGVGCEWSLQFSGYLAGAVDAAARGVQQCLAADLTATQESDA